MRLWRLDPSYLDGIGLIAAWREALLGKSALVKKQAYYNHNNLIDFKAYSDPINQMNWFLFYIWIESLNRHYKFDESKIGRLHPYTKMQVTTGQVEYELRHLKHKLIERSPSELPRLLQYDTIKAHRLFVITDGPVMPWEKVISYPG